MNFLINPFVFAVTTPFINTRSLSMSDVADALTRTQGIGASRQRMTFSIWFRSNDVGNALSVFTSSNSGVDLIAFSGTPSVLLNNGLAGLISTTGAVFSNNTYYHIVVQLDTANATAGDRCKIFVDGIDRTSTSTPVTLNYNTGWGLNGDIESGPSEQSGISTTLIDEFSKIDNQVLSPANFSTTNIPVDISGLTFGSQGYWLRFETTTGTDEGIDSSGNGLTFTSTYDNADSSITVP